MKELKTTHTTIDTSTDATTHTTILVRKYSTQYTRFTSDRFTMNGYFDMPFFKMDVHKAIDGHSASDGLFSSTRIWVQDKRNGVLSQVKMSPEMINRFTKALDIDRSTYDCFKFMRMMLDTKECNFISTLVTEDDLKPGDPIGLRNVNGDFVHYAIYVGYGCYVSKFGSSQILAFTSFQSMVDCYVTTIQVFRLAESPKSSAYCAMVNPSFPTLMALVLSISSLILFRIVRK